MSDGGATPIERPWAQPTDIENAWRPLTDAQTDRAPFLIDSVERAILREWPSVTSRLAAGTLSVDDIIDVVVWSVLPVLGVDTDIPVNAKAFQETSGSESRSVTLDGDLGGTWMTFAPWMVRVFEGGVGAERPRGPVSRFSSPPPGNVERAGFLGPHRATQRSWGAER